MLHSVCQQIWTTQQGHRTGKGQFSFQSQRRAMPKNAQTTVQMWSFHMLVRVCSNTFQARCQQYVNQEPPDVQAGFWRGRGTRDQIANICWNLEKAREIQKNIYSCFIGNTKAFDCVDHKNWKILKEMGVPDMLLVSWENCMQVKKQQNWTWSNGAMDWFKIGRGVHQGCVFSLCLFNLYAEYIIRNARLISSLGIKIAGRNINSFRYAHDTIVMAESKEEQRASW